MRINLSLAILKKTKLLLYGLQRSGTNYLQTLLFKNFNVVFLNNDRNRGEPLQKHFRLYDQKNAIPEPRYRNNYYIRSLSDFEEILPKVPDYYLIISKDPYSWLLSYIKWAKKCNWDDVSHHYIDEYNYFYGKWLELSSDHTKVIFVRYIDLLFDIDEVINQLECNLQLNRKKSIIPFRMPAYSKVPKSSVFTVSQRDYYLNKEYLKKYSREDLSILNNILDFDVVKRLGYVLEFTE